MIADQDEIFEKTPLKRGLKCNNPVLYSARMTNFECCANPKCGKIKIGYIMAENDVIPSYHEVRLKQTCPDVEISWIVLKGIQVDAKDAAKRWEKMVFEDLKDHRLRQDKELFRFSLSNEIIFESVTRIGRLLAHEYSADEMIFHNCGIKVPFF